MSCAIYYLGMVPRYYFYFLGELENVSCTQHGRNNSTALFFEKKYGLIFFLGWLTKWFLEAL